MPFNLADALTAVVGSGHVLIDPDLRAGYEIDWMGRTWGQALAVARPANVAELIAVVDVCRAQELPMLIQGGNTGLVGGGVPAGGEVVISTLRLTSISEFDPIFGTVTVGAGARLAAVGAWVAAAGWEVGVDLAARDTATIGGMVATNAGGLRVLRNGTMKAQLLGLRAVLSDGSVIDRLTGPAKDSSGYDLSSLLAGSEGTLAIITDVKLRLVRHWPMGATAVVGFASVSQAAQTVRTLVSDLPSLQSAEFMLAEAVDFLCEHLGCSKPLPAPAAVYVLLDCQAATDPSDQLIAALGRLGHADAVVAADRGGRDRLWELRERQSEVAGSAGVPVKLDVALPLAAIDEVLMEMTRAIRVLAPEAKLLIFGHLAEGNLHVNVVGEFLPVDALTDAVLGIVARAGGSISAEHGIGRAKKRWLGLTRNRSDRAAMRALKAAWDPQALLGRGVLFDD